MPIALHGIAPADVLGALVAFPVGAIAVHRLLTSGYERYAPSTGAWSRPPARAWFINLTVLALVIGIPTVATYVTPLDAGAIWLFLGTSMIVAALRGDGGCEVLAFSNLATGRRDAVGCFVFAPIDAAEHRLGIASAASTESTQAAREIEDTGR